MLNITFMTQTCIAVLDAHNLHYNNDSPNRIDIPQTYIDKSNVDQFLNPQKK